MPNQNQPDPNQNPKQEPINTIPFSPQSDLPPLPPDFMNMENSTPTNTQPAPTETPSATPAQTPTPGEDTGSAAPPTPVFSNIMPSTPKKKFGTKKIIATILGLFLLAGGVVAGVYTVGQKQLFQQKAANGGLTCNADCNCYPDDEKICNDKYFSKSCTGKYEETNGSCTVTITCKGTKKCDGGGETKGPLDYVAACDDGTNTWQCGDCGGFCISKNNSYTCSEVAMAKCGVNEIGTCLVGTPICSYCPNVFTMGNGCQGEGSISPPSGVYYDSGTCSIAGDYCGLIQCDDTKGNFKSLIKKTSNTYSCKTSTDKPEPTKTPVAPFCAAIATYTSDWKLITADERASLKKGDVINFCVSGTTSSGPFESAKFTINGTQYTETTTRRPSSTDLCQRYTVAEGTTTASALMYHSSFGWF